MRGSGTVVQDNRTKSWMFLWWDDGKRKSKSLGQHPNRTSAWRSAKPYRDALEARPARVKPLRHSLVRLRFAIVPVFSASVAATAGIIRIEAIVAQEYSASQRRA